MADDAMQFRPEAIDIGAAQAFDPVAASGSGARCRCRNRTRLFLAYCAQRVIVRLIVAGGFHSYKSWSPFHGSSAGYKRFYHIAVLFGKLSEMILNICVTSAKPSGLNATDRRLIRMSRFCA